MPNNTQTSQRARDTFYNAQSPDVSIIILNLDRPDLTVACLESLWANTSGVSYEVIVVDNGSNAKNYAQLAAYKGPHKLVRLQVNRFFGEGNNIGAEQAKGRFLVFMNNDIVVTEGWLEPLIETFSNYPDVGACGPKFVYPSGELQEAGALLDVDGTSVQIGKFQSPDQPRFNQDRTVDYVSAATVMMRKADFDSVLGFDFRYEPAYYEDCDLCLKIATLGKKTYYVPKSKVIHHENMTTADTSHNLQLKNIVELNREKFVKRWAQFLETGRHSGRSFASSVVPERPATPTKTAGFFTPYNIIPGGGERYLLSVMEVFAAQGYALTLIVPERFSRLRLTSVLKNLDINLPGLDIVTYDEAMQGKRFDLFYCLGNEICPSSPGLGKRNIYCCQFPFQSDPAELQRRLPWLSDYGAIVCYSEFVEGFLRDKLVGTGYEGIDLQVIYPPVGLVADGGKAKKTGILSIGRFFAGGHCKRQDVMIEAIRDLTRQGIETELHLVGSLHPEAEHRKYAAECKAKARGLPVVFHIDAAPEDLTELLRSSSIYWHGAGLGIDAVAAPEKCEHFGISVVEAMSARLIPFVVNNGGPASIVEDGVSGHHYASRSELVEGTARLLRADEAERQRLRNNAFERSGLYSYDAFRNRWTSLLQGLAESKVRSLDLLAAQNEANARSKTHKTKFTGHAKPDQLMEWVDGYSKRLSSVANFDEMRALWKSSNFPYRMENTDPYSDAYRAEVLELYSRLVKTPYNVQNEITSSLLSPEDFAIGYPWVSKNLDVVAAELGKAVLGVRAIAKHCSDAKSVIEFGVGWGNSAIPLARAGLTVCAVDIDRAFLNRVENEAAALSVTIKTLHAEFLEAARDPGQRYDVVLFSSSFHHCLEFKELLLLIRDNVLTENGSILFFAEPISNEFTFPWGLRYDGEALWAITCNKWLELGFSEDFFRGLMRQTGFDLEEIPDPSGITGSGWVARKTAKLS